jgi:hypothetical protein
VHWSRSLQASTTSPIPEDAKALSERADSLAAELHTTKQQLQNGSAEAAAMRTAADAALARQAELHAMLSVIAAYNDDDRDLVACRTSEKRLEAALAEAEAQLKDAGVDASDPHTAVVRAALWQQRSLEARREADAAAAALAAAERIAVDAKAQQQEAEAMFAETSKELDETGEACDRAQRQNAELLKLLALRDDAAAAATAAEDTV